MILKLIARRLAMLVFVLFGVVVLTFFISRLIPTDPARLIAGDFASEEVVEQIRAELGFDRTLFEQFWIYLGDLLQGDLGTSITTGQPVLQDLATYAPATIELAVVAMLIAVVGGIVLGVLSAVYKDGWIDNLVRVVALTGVSTPSFWLALLFLLLFYGTLGWFPAGGRIDPTLVPFERVTGLYLVDSLIALRPDAFFSALSHLMLPASCLGLITMGVFARLIRASLLEELGRAYIRTFRSIGLSERRLVFGHALPNALTPFITQLGLSFAAMLTGAVVTEAIFGWPGMGGYILQATQSLDFPAIIGFTVMVGVIYAVLNLIIDIVYLFLDPRLRKGAVK